MKFFIILALFLAISVHVIVSQEGETGNGETPTNPEGNGGTETPSDNESSESEIPPAGEEGQDEGGEEADEGGDDTAGDEGAETPNNGTDTETGDTENGNSNSTGGDTKTNAMKVDELIKTLPQKCQARYTFCYGPTSDNDDTKDKDIASEDDDEVCELIEDGEDCVTKEVSGNMCSEDDYEKVRELACSANRSAILSVVLLSVLSLISKILSQH